MINTGTMVSMTEIARCFTDHPVRAGIWVSDHGVVVAVNGRVVFASHHHLGADSCRVLATVLAEAADYLDGRVPDAVLPHRS